MVRHFAECIRDGKTTADRRRGRSACGPHPGGRPAKHQGPRRTNHALRNGGRLNGTRAPTSGQAPSIGPTVPSADACDYE